MFMRALLIGILVAVSGSLLVGDSTPSPTGNRTTPPTINVVSPRGVARGTTVELTIEGLNLAKARAIYFDNPAVKGTITRVKELPDLPDIRFGANGGISTVDLGPLPPRNQVTVELEVAADAQVGPVNFRLQNDLGTSPAGRFLIEPYYGESPDKEPNNTPEDAFEAFLPTILVGETSRPGDVDFFKIKVKDGERLVFENGAMMLGSQLQPVVTILREDQSIEAQFGMTGGRERTTFAHKFEKGGTYYVRVSDYAEGGKPSYFYRIKVGDFPVATAAFPLGVQKGKTADVQVAGYDVDARAQVKGVPTDDMEDTVKFRAPSPDGDSFNELRLAVGIDPEVKASGKNLTVGSADPVAVPVTINGILNAPAKDETAQQYFRFHAKKGERFVLEVNARRLGSDLDSFVEVLDAKGNPIETATVRAVSETNVTLADKDSNSVGIRLAGWADMKVGDYLLAGSELMRISAMPRGPDDDMVFDNFQGRRLAYFGTSPEAHALDSPVYRVQLYPPGKQFSPNGLPLVRLYARNDDGGPAFGKDSYLDFTAPADGDYVVRIRDVRNLSGDTYAYRLNIRPPRPDFKLSVFPSNPNVPEGGSVPLRVTALRLDGFEGAIKAELEGLPAGLHAANAVIAPGQDSTVVLLSADQNAKLDSAVPLRIAGRTTEGIVHYANPGDKLKLIALMPKADVAVEAHTKEVTLAPGEIGEIHVKIARDNGFGGRVPVELMNLPPRVIIEDFGLNGVLIDENQTERSFKIRALPNAEPIEQDLYVGGQVETRSPLQTTFMSPEPILLRVKAKAVEASAERASTGSAVK